MSRCMKITHRALAAGVLLALAACGSTSTPQPSVFVDPLAPAERLALVQAAAGGEEDELHVQPLRDPQVEDLRLHALAAREQGNLVQAQQLLDQALQLIDNDPAILQERAELSLLLADPAQAEDHARRALALGSRTGPLCRRHWATIWQARQARNETLNADSAQAQIPGCTVPPIQRF